MNNSDNITLRLAAADVLQTLDALGNRAEAWERTQALLNGETETDEEFFIPEECEDPSEAAEISQHFRDIISKIDEQLAEHNRTRLK